MNVNGLALVESVMYSSQQDTHHRGVALIMNKQSAGVGATSVFEPCSGEDHHMQRRRCWKRLLSCDV